MENTIDRELAAGKVEQILSVIDAAVRVFDIGWGDDKNIRAFVDNLGATLNALQTLTHAIVKEIGEGT